MNHPKRITLQDIAKSTGYSVNTVSHALRGLSDISPETTAQIRDAAQSLGYTGNQIASSLRSGRTHILALIIGNLTNPFYGIMANAIQQAAQAKGYSLMIMCSDEDSTQELHLVNEAISHCADGVLLFPTEGSAPTIQRLQSAKMPYVLMFRSLNDSISDCVVCDERAGARLAALHLIHTGHRKLVYVSRENIVYSSQQRTLGFVDGCNEMGIPEDDRQFLTHEGTSFCSYDLWEEHLQSQLPLLRDQGYTGLFVFCDVEAWQVLSVLEHTPGLSPQDFAIVSFDKIENAISFPMPLCSVEYSFDEMAVNAIRVLRGRIHGHSHPPETVICPVRLSC